MSAMILDGKKLAQTIQAELALEVSAFVAKHGYRPELAAVLVGQNHPGRAYVRNKRKACEAVGISSRLDELADDATEDDLLSLIARLNNAEHVHGILVQLPLPKGIREEVIVDAVTPLKDVDGFGPLSLGYLTAGRPRFRACTPSGVMEMFKRYQIPVSGKHVVIVGRSNIVGKPLALMLSQKGVDATVTVCHSKTQDIAKFTREADIVVMAIGQAEFLKADMIRPGAVVIDVGMNLCPSGGWVGDVDFGAVKEKASAITPVPGGVGPMTIAMLLVNTLQAAKYQLLEHAGEPVPEI
jgi:methylenetetrahydrofolate dehydrogenase (NADP+)/methenyltetrahydrofolate cyclohydrolase